MKCHNCNRTVTRKSKFCPDCGNPIIPRSSSKPQSKQKLPAGYVVVLLILGAVVGYGISKLGSGNRELRSLSTFNSANGVRAASVTEVAREFNCVCGTCDHSLEACSCEHPKGALEVKDFIAQQLRRGHKKPHIMEMVEDKYGGLKSKTEPALRFNLPSN